MVDVTKVKGAQTLSTQRGRIVRRQNPVNFSQNVRSTSRRLEDVVALSKRLKMLRALRIKRVRRLL